MSSQRHLDAYARYTELIWRQLDALDRRDLDRVAELADQRRALESVITALPSLHELPGSVLDAVAAQIQRGLHADALLRDRLTEHRRELRGRLLESLVRARVPGQGRAGIAARAQAS